MYFFRIVGFLVALCLLVLQEGAAQSDTLLNEYKVFYYPNGTKSSEGMLINGKPEGLWKSYHETGVLKSIGKRSRHQPDSTWVFYDKEGNVTSIINYREGKKDGQRITFELGKKILEETYENDLKIGEELAFYPNCAIKRISPYQLSKLDGLQLEYDSTGLLQEMREYKEGILLRLRKVNRTDKRGLKQGLWVELDDNRVVRREMTYRDNLLDGYLKTFDAKGELVKVQKYVNGVLQESPEELKTVRMAKTWFPGAKIKSKGAYDGDLPVGLHIEYDLDGNIVASTLYEQGVLLAKGITDQQNRKQGLWKEYYPDGSLKAEGEYADDLKIKVWKFYYPNGKTEQTGSYVNGKPNGRWQWFYDDGKLFREEEYRNGAEDGFSIELTLSGDTLSFGEYVEGEREGKWRIQSGEILMQGNYQSGLKSGVWEYLYANGKLRFSGNYIQGFPDGKHTYYFENGKIQQEGRYKMGKKEGDWRKYDESGLLIFTVTYKDGIEIKYEGVRIKPGFEPADYEFIVEDTYF